MMKTTLRYYQILNMAKEGYGLDSLRWPEALEVFAAENHYYYSRFMLPEIDGLKRRTIRKTSNADHCPIHKDTEFDKVIGLEIGADDYM